ncbi:MAG: NAD-dependent protein deacylase [Thermoleophilia bacterium]|nr:NAD-dependent protein deacylase [Thermoleophilia bacterium]
MPSGSTAASATVERLAELVTRNQPTVVLTGAGASEESGIPTFRGPGGPVGERSAGGGAGTSGRAPQGIRRLRSELDPREYATLGAFRRDPEKVWRFYGPRIAMVAAAEPNRAHRALVRLEEAGLVRAVVTQNTDLLHQRAGSRCVVEVHGSVATSSCPRCRSRFRLDDVLALIEATDGVPRCARCEGVLKPDVVFFDELLPAEALDRATALARAARLLLVVGSSLEVYPAAGLPQATVDAGGLVAVVNRGPTGADSRAALTLDASAGDVLAELAARLLPAGQPVVVSEHDPAWRVRAEREAERVHAALGRRVVAVEHIGSTSVPGLAAKPVLDLLVGLRELELARAEVRRMEGLGYEYLGEFGLPGRLFFRKGLSRRTHHVHAVEHGGDLWREHLAFRDYLRAHPEEARLYGEEKRRVAEAVGRRWERYAEAKTRYTAALAKRARAWAGLG